MIPGGRTTGTTASGRPDWENWLLNYLVPLAQRRLHICAGRSEHSIAGLSMGGYGAVYLASQRPSYFGSAGSFLRRSVLRRAPTSSPPSPRSTRSGDPPVTSTPSAMIPWRSWTTSGTRGCSSVSGTGFLSTARPTATVSVLEEEEFDQESIAFAKKARSAHVSVTFDQHAGTHDPDQLDPVAAQHARPGSRSSPVVRQPRSWQFDTVETDGDAWG